MSARMEIAPGVFRDASNVVELASESREAALWGEYCSLVQQRERENLWTDSQHNKRIGRAWDRWWKIARIRDGGEQ